MNPLLVAAVIAIAIAALVFLSLGVVAFFHGLTDDQQEHRRRDV